MWNLGWEWSCVLNPPSNNKHAHTVSDLASKNASANIWLASESLAKSFYSTIITDLGQTTMVPKILLNATALQHFTQNFTSMQNNAPNAQPGPACDSYEALKDQMRPLNTSTAVISTKYPCQVSRRKSTGTLLVVSWLRTWCLCRRCGRFSLFVRWLGWRKSLLKVRTDHAYDMMKF